MRITLDGAKRYKLKLRKTAAQVETNVNVAVAECGEDLLAEALPLTPEDAPDGGRLRESGYVDNERLGVSEVGFTARYAFYVHEMGITVYPERSPITWTTPGTGAKFLQRPWVLNRDRYAEKIKDAAKRGLE